MILSSCLIAKSVDKSELSHAANDIMGGGKEHVFGKTVGRTSNQGPFIGTKRLLLRSLGCVGKRRLIM